MDVGERKRRRPKGSKLSRKITAVAASLKRGSLIRPNVNTSDALTIAVPSPSSPSSLQPLLSFHIRDRQNSNARRQKETNARDSPKLAFPTDGIIPEAPPTITFAGTALHGAFESIDGVGREASPRPGARPGAPPGGARGRGASVNLQIRKATPTEYAYQGITGNVGLTKLSVLPAANLLADFRRIADLDSAAINERSEHDSFVCSLLLLFAPFFFCLLSILLFAHFFVCCRRQRCDQRGRGAHDAG